MNLEIVAIAPKLLDHLLILPQFPSRAEAVKVLPYDSHSPDILFIVLNSLPGVYLIPYVDIDLWILILVIDLHFSDHYSFSVIWDLFGPYQFRLSVVSRANHSPVSLHMMPYQPFMSETIELLRKKHGPPQGFEHKVPVGH